MVERREGGYALLGKKGRKLQFTRGRGVRGYVSEEEEEKKATIY